MFVRSLVPTKELNNFDNFFNSFFDESKIAERNWSPSTDVVEDENNYELHFELPGLNKEDVSIKVEKNVLFVSGERKNESEEKTKNYHRIERSYGKFSRSFKLPENTKQDDINAEFKNGVLTVTVPKAEEEKPKAIDISVK